jgi:hypothetical protein
VVCERERAREDARATLFDSPECDRSFLGRLHVRREDLAAAEDAFARAVERFLARAPRRLPWRRRLTPTHSSRSVEGRMMSDDALEHFSRSSRRAQLELDLRRVRERIAAVDARADTPTTAVRTSEIPRLAAASLSQVPVRTALGACRAV